MHTLECLHIRFRKFERNRETVTMIFHMVFLNAETTIYTEYKSKAV